MMPASRAQRITKDVTVPAVHSMLNAASLPYSPRDEHSVDVDGRFLLFLATGFWRTQDGSLRGYGVSSMIAAARRNAVPASERR